jgi:hypothetical protein
MIQIRMVFRIHRRYTGISVRRELLFWLCRYLTDEDFDERTVLIILFSVYKGN